MGDSDLSTDDTDHRVWRARENVIGLYEDAKEADNEVLKDELEEIEHRLCVVEQMVRGGGLSTTDTDQGGSS